MRVPLSKLQNGFKDIDFNTFQQIEGLEFLNSNPKNVIVFEKYKRYQNKFNQGYNKEAEFIIFENNESYEKLCLSVNLFTPQDLAEKRKNRLANRNNTTSRTLESLSERGKKQRSGLSVFINGKKIKDSLIMISVFNGSTDVYIPSLLLEEENNTIMITTEKYNKYFKYYQEEIDNDYTGSYLVDKSVREHFVLFSDGLAIPKTLYKEQEFDNYIAITPYVNLYNVEIRSMGIATKEDSISIRKPIFRIEGFNQPISSKIMEIYVNGERLLPSDVINLPENMFLLNLEKEDNETVNIHYRLHLISTDNSDSIDYDNNYAKIARFLNFEKVKEILIDEKSIKGVPTFFNLENIKREFPSKYFGTPNPLKIDNNLELTLYNLIKSYVGEDSHYLKLFLKQFLIPETNHKYCYEKKKKYERIDTREEISTKQVTYFKELRVVYPFSSEFENFVVLVKKNKKLIDHRDFIIIKRPNTKYYFVYIKSDIINDNDVIELNIKEQTKYTEYKKQLIVNGVSTYSFNTIPYNVIEDIDVAVLPCNKSTYRILNKEDYIISEIDGSINVTLNIGEDLFESIIIFNPLTTGRHVFMVQSDDPMTNTVIPLNVLDEDNNKYPLFSGLNFKGNIEVYCQGQQLMEGKDFRILTPTINNDLEDLEMVLTFVPNKGDIIEIFQKEHRQDILVNIEKIDSTNGLVYLKDLDIPFSFKYLDVFLNGKPLSEENVEVIADNFIKLKNVNSLSNFVIMEKLIIDDLTLLDLLSKIKNKTNTFEEFITKEIIEDKKDPDEWFESLDKEGNLSPDINTDKIDPSEDDYVDDRFDLGLHQLANALITGTISRRIDSNKPDPELSKQDFYKYFVDDEIKIDCNNQNIRVDCIIDPNQLYLTRQEVAEIFGKEIEDGTFEMDVDGTILDSDPIYNYIYPENEIILDANTVGGADDVIVLDANAYV